MRVNTYEVDSAGTETLTAENVILSDYFPGEENDEEYYAAHNNIVANGEYWGGGGASPIFVLRAVPPAGDVGSVAAHLVRR